MTKFSAVASAVLVLMTATSMLAQEPSGNTVVPLWVDGAPGFEDRRNEPEEAKDWWVKNIHNPSLTVFLPPPEKANGTAAVIVPGGGHRLLVFDGEGTMMAEYLNQLGVTAFVLKHRLAREENSPYQIETHALQDGQRAMRLVRSRADEWNLKADRIGMVGFSAGGEVVSMVTYAGDQTDGQADDPIDRLSPYPDFQVLIYPGPLGIPETFPEKSKLPPALVICAADDGASKNIIQVMTEYQKRGASIEAHLYAAGGHGFNMGQRAKRVSIQTWPDRLADWMKDQGWLEN